MVRANAMLARSPAQRQIAEERANAYEVARRQTQREEKEKLQKRRQGAREAWRQKAARFLLERRRRAHAEGKVEILPEPGEPPDEEWFSSFLVRRVPGLLLSQCRYIGRFALAMGADACPRWHKNPPAFTLNYAKRVMKGQVACWVAHEDVIGREHLLKMDQHEVRFADNDVEAGELPPDLRDAVPEVAVSQTTRTGQLEPVCSMTHGAVSRGTSVFVAQREPGED